MTAERLKTCIEQIRALNGCLNVLLQSIQELDETNRHYGGPVFTTLIFLSAEVKKELAFLENLLRDQEEERKILNNNS
jgi:hypothetical protein